MTRALGLVRWLPVAAGIAYAVVLVRRIGDIVDQLTWNADYVSQIALAQSIGEHGKSGRAIVIQVGYFWFDLLTYPLPFHRSLWLYGPYALALAALALLAWTAWRVAGRFAAALTGALGVAASPLVLGTQAAQAYHGSTWFAAALLASYLAWILTVRPGRGTALAVSVGVGVVAGLATASDPLLLVDGDLPLAAAMVIVWRARRADVPLDALAPAAALIVAAGLTAGLALVGDRLAGYASSFPRGLTHPVTPAHFAGNVRQLASGLFEVAGMPRGGGSPLGLLLGLLLAAAVVLPLAWLIRAYRGPLPAPTLALVAFWSASAVFVAGAFLFSDIPADFLQNSGRYLVPMFYVATGTLPLWAAANARRAALVAVPIALFVAANAAAVEHDAASRHFEPSFSPPLQLPIAFLEQHHLTRGYASYDEATPITVKSDFALHVAPFTEVLLSPDESCGEPPSQTFCPFAYNSLSDWYTSSDGPTFVLVDPATNRLGTAPPASLDPPIAVYKVGQFVIYVYADDIASHVRLPAKFTRSLI